MDFQSFQLQEEEKRFETDKNSFRKRIQKGLQSEKNQKNNEKI